jgi:hypothetical protein
MKYFFILFLLISSCSTGYKEPVENIESTQDICEQTHSQFVEIYECLKSDLSLVKNDEIELYLLKGEQLKEKLDLGKMTEADARYEWKKLLYDIKQLRSEMRYRMMYERICRTSYRGHCVPW